MLFLSDRSDDHRPITGDDETKAQYGKSVFLANICIKRLLEKRTIITNLPHTRNLTKKMAKSNFEYVKKFELDDSLLPNTWIVVRLDGKCFHKFSDDHNFNKPNDLRALNLMNYAAYMLIKEFHDVLMAYGQSDEYSFIFKKHTNLYNRRSAKLLTTINSKFTSSYVYFWKKFFDQEQLKYPPTFDGRIILYPTDENLIDYLKWRQVDTHINNLYNTTFWNLVLQGNLSRIEAEKRLCGTVSSDKNEILFNEFNINYNNEPDIYKRGTILLRRLFIDKETNKQFNVIADVHDDMLKEKFWKDNSDLMISKSGKKESVYTDQFTDMIKEQIALQDITIDAKNTNKLQTNQPYACL